jgi:CheY-like chemotaxis protein
MADYWQVAVVEDTEDMRRLVKDFLERQTYADRKVRVQEFADFDSAREMVGSRKVDLIILDIFEGAPDASKKNPDTPGLEVLEEIKKSVFVPVIIYTAAPEKVKDAESAFVKVVGKGDRAFREIDAKVKEFFALKIPQVSRAVASHLEKVSSRYMWEYVAAHWDKFKVLVDKPEFVRIFLQRLAHAITTTEIPAVEAEVFAKPQGLPIPASEEIHPVEMYIMPPIGDGSMLGDIRAKGDGADREFWVVLWPSCDLVSGGTRKAKTDKVLCARGFLLSTTAEYKDWAKEKTAKKKIERLEDLFANNRDSNHGTKERFHFLPAVVDMPDLLVDFQALSHFPLDEFLKLPRISTLASPFAESMAARFSSYIMRLGTPDLNLKQVMDRL